MNMRLRYLLVVVFSLAAVALVGGKRLLYSQVTVASPPISSPAAQSFLVILGVGDKTPTKWDGSITATGATILSLQGWRFSATDAISGTSSWTLSSRQAPPPPSQTSGPMQENGIIVTIAAPTGLVTFNVQTAQGN